MKSSEFLHILAAIVVLTLVAGFSFIIKGNWEIFAMVFGFSAIIIALSVLAKKGAAYLLDSNVEHEIWNMSRYGLIPSWHLKKPIPAGIIFPLFFTLFTLGIIKFTAILTYETRALKYRAAKRFGFYSYKEMTDWHNGLIGAAGILSLLILSLITYLSPMNLEYLAKMSAYYAFWNLLPISKLDGTQILFGSRILWAVFAAIASIFTILAIITI